MRYYIINMLCFNLIGLHFGNSALWNYIKGYIF